MIFNAGTFYPLLTTKFRSYIKFLSALEIQFHTGLLRSTKYCDFKCQSFSASVYT